MTDALLRPASDCALCPRLAEYRLANQQKFPDFFNAPVPPFGDSGAALAIVGLAPGLKGANRTGRVFTGDFAGDLLFATLKACGLTRGDYQAHAGDSLELVNCRIINAVACVPPQNKVSAFEIKNCNGFLRRELENMPNLRVLVSLGQVAHQAVLRAYDLKPSGLKFAHGACHRLENMILLNSYHCSRYNTQTKRLSAQAFLQIFIQAREALAQTGNDMNDD